MYSDKTDSYFESLETESDPSVTPQFIKSKAKNFLKYQDETSYIESQITKEEVNWHEDNAKNIKHEYQPNVFDVAAYIVSKLGTISTMKLQKLVYYAQAWSLVWDEQPLFQEPIEAWANGPVVRDLFYFHIGQFSVSSIPIGNPSLLNNTQRETIDAVLGFYGDKPAQWLIDLSHQEKP